MNITNLSQLKAALVKGRRFEIVKHYVKPDLAGLREVNVVQTNGIYTKFPDKPADCSENLTNQGRGYWLGFGRAKDWVFENGICRLTVTRIDQVVDNVLELKVLD